MCLIQDILPILQFRSFVDMHTPTSQLTNVLGYELRLEIGLEIGIS